MSERENEFFIKGEIKGKYKSKKLALYYLYLYHENYKTEDIETKREIREFYESQLRYKGAFYKDKRIFEIRGNPLEWEDEKISRFKPVEEEHRYFVGMPYFTDFAYPSNRLIGISISKEVDISLIDKQEVEMINVYFDEIIRREIKGLLKRMERIDNSKGVYLIKSLYSSEMKYYDVSFKQVTFKIQTDDIVRYQSTKFIPESHLIENAVNVLQSYLAQLTQIESKTMPSFVRKEERYEEFDESFNLQSCYLIRIYVNKNTVMYDASLGERYYEGVHLEANTLKSLEIVSKNG